MEYVVHALESLESEMNALSSLKKKSKSCKTYFSGTLIRENWEGLRDERKFKEPCLYCLIRLFRDDSTLLFKRGDTVGVFTLEGIARR